MAQSMNVVAIVGNLTKDPETVSYGSGDNAGTVTTLRVAVNRRPPRGGGESKADYFDVKVFGKQGEMCQQYLAKGRPVAANGRIQIDEVVSKDDASRKLYFTSIIADSVQFLGSNPENSNSDAPAAKADSTDLF